MADITINDLSAAGIPLSDTDQMHIQQSGVDKKLALQDLAEYILWEAPKSISIQTITINTDLAIIDTDARIFVNSTAGNITLGLFNGASRDGVRIDIMANGSANQVFVELTTDGVTDYTLNITDSLAIIWDDTNSAWFVVRS